MKIQVFMIPVSKKKKYNGPCGMTHTATYDAENIGTIRPINIGIPNQEINRIGIFSRINDVRIDNPRIGIINQKIQQYTKMDMRIIHNYFGAKCLYYYLKIKFLSSGMLLKRKDSCFRDGHVKQKKINDYYKNMPLWLNMFFDLKNILEEKDSCFRTRVIEQNEISKFVKIIDDYDQLSALFDGLFDSEDILLLEDDLRFIYPDLKPKEINEFIKIMDDYNHFSAWVYNFFHSKNALKRKSLSFITRIIEKNRIDTYLNIIFHYYQLSGLFFAYLDIMSDDGQARSILAKKINDMMIHISLNTRYEY